jgi:hypothetical protein
MAKARKTNVLVVFANPKGTDLLCLSSEDRAIRESIKLRQNRDRIHLVIRSKFIPSEKIANEPPYDPPLSGTTLSPTDTSFQDAPSITTPNSSLDSSKQTPISKNRRMEAIP